MTLQRSALNNVKADFSSIYTEKRPETYYKAMEQLDYRIPENAKPIVSHFISKISQRLSRPVKILDLGCSYGVLPAIIKHDLPLCLLYRRYLDGLAKERSLDDDRYWFKQLPRRTDALFYGLDSSENALAYSKSVGLLEDGIAIDLEQPNTDHAQLRQLPKDIDIVATIGCVGYVSDLTFSKILKHLDVQNMPVFISFALRAFDYSDITNILVHASYDTFTYRRKTFVQRRFRDRHEQCSMISLAEKKLGIDKVANIPELDGYCHAELFVSVPKDKGQEIAPELLSTMEQV